MKKGFIVTLLATATLLSGCNLFRSLAGRPSSGELEAKKARIELARALEAARLDSLERARKDSLERVARAEADSVAATVALASLGIVKEASGIGTFRGLALPARYSVVAGAFSDPSNARKLAAKYTDAGFECVAFPCRGGFTAVLVAPSSRVASVYGSYLRIQELPFRTADAWILSND